MSAYLNGAFWSGLVRCVLLIVPVSVMAHWIKERHAHPQVPFEHLQEVAARDLQFVVKNHLIGTSKAVRQIQVENSTKIIMRAPSCRTS